MLCLVTDRRRLAGSDASADRARQCLLLQARFAAEAGVDLLQIRERDLTGAELASLVRAVVAVARGTSMRVIVNDRVDVAIACGADGVHLRGDSIRVSAARRIAPRGFRIGRSVHSVEEAVGAADADYLIAGTVFASASKPGAAGLLGVDGLAAVTRAVSTPVLAIGGVTEARIDQIGRAGASGCAAIGLFLAEIRAGSADACGAVPVDALVERMRRRFDTVKTAP